MRPIKYKCRIYVWNLSHKPFFLFPHSGPRSAPRNMLVSDPTTINSLCELGTCRWPCHAIPHHLRPDHRRPHRGICKHVYNKWFSDHVQMTLNNSPDMLWILNMACLFSCRPRCQETDNSVVLQNLDPDTPLQHQSDRHLFWWTRRGAGRRWTHRYKGLHPHNHKVLPLFIL